MNQPDQAAVPVRWVTAVALKALADHKLGAGAEFTSFDLAKWTARDLSPDQRVHASSRLCALDMVRHSVEVIMGERTDVYRITTAGAAAIEAAGAGHVHKSGPKGSRLPNPAKPLAMTTRLWHLMRQRRKLDADEAAQLLCDAGDAKRFNTARDTIQRQLRRWAQAGFLAESSKRVGGDSPQSNGFKRYVLQQDCGPNPPQWRPILKAQRAQAPETAP